MVSQVLYQPTILSLNLIPFSSNDLIYASIASSTSESESVTSSENASESIDDSYSAGSKSKWWTETVPLKETDFFIEGLGDAVDDEPGVDTSGDSLGDTTGVSSDVTSEEATGDVTGDNFGDPGESLKF